MRFYLCAFLALSLFFLSSCLTDEDYTLSQDVMAEENLLTKTASNLGSGTSSIPQPTANCNCYLSLDVLHGNGGSYDVAFFEDVDKELYELNCMGPESYLLNKSTNATDIDIPLNTVGFTGFEFKIAFRNSDIPSNPSVGNIHWNIICPNDARVNGFDAYPPGWIGYVSAAEMADTGNEWLDVTLGGQATSILYNCDGRPVCGDFYPYDGGPEPGDGENP